MNTPSIPIISLRLLDIELPRKPYSMINFIGAAKDLLRNHQERTEAEGIDLNLFHNDDITYSGIQLDRYRNCPEWTGYGEEAVETLWFWLELFRAGHPHLLKNSVVIQEHYTPAFLLFEQKYEISSIILSKGVLQDLHRLRDTKDQHLRLQKYLYGNLQTFFKHIGFTFDKNIHFLNIRVTAVQQIKDRMAVFREHKKTAHQISFTCNFHLPQSLRLGQSTGLGYGKVKYV